MTNAERDTVLTTIAGVNAGQVPLLVGAVEQTTNRVVEEAQRMVSLGADGIVATSQYYAISNAEETGRHIRTVAASVDVPLFVYDVPVRTHFKMPTDLLLELGGKWGGVAGLGAGLFPEGLPPAAAALVASTAVLLAVVVTVTHTALVVILGLVIWFYQRTHPQIGPSVQLWLGTIAGLLVAGMGLSLLYRAFVGGHHHDHSHGHHHHPPHEHHRDHTHPHHEDHGHLHDHSHRHADEHHDHGPPNRVTVRMLLLLGVTGGLVPCPTATIIMLLGIGANVVIGALYAVLVFSLGLALTLMTVGFFALYSRRFAARLMTAPDHNGAPSAHGHWLLNRLIPALSGLAVLALGVALTVHYLHLLRTGRALFAWLQ